MKFWIWIFLLCLNFSASQGQTSGYPPLSSRIANYVLKARLYPEKKAVEGEARLDWRNASSDTVRELQFHLYLNAFKNEKSTFMRESGGRHRAGTGKTYPNAWGWIDILQMRIVNGPDLTAQIQYIAPDDGNPDDQTVIRIPLPVPVLPGRSLLLDYHFYSKLPRVFSRSGFADPDFYMVAQWYPKIGVWENGRWNCHQYHANSEFFADFGVYEMSLTVPKGYKVGANGIRTGMDDKDSLVVYHYRQEDVHDAVWVASPHMTEHRQSVFISGKKQPVEIFYLLPKEKTELIARYEKITPKMFQYLHEMVGEYPYPNLTIVEPPGEEAMTAGGMEYPTLITTGSFGNDWIEPWLRIHFLEIVTFHEFAHNYFQGMVASNEFEEPWLDEGFASYLEYRMLRRYFDELGVKGDYAEVFSIPVQSLDYHRFSYLSQPRKGTIIQNAWEMDKSFYAVGAYNKPVLVLMTLERYLSRPRMDLILQEYFRRWKFQHPRTQDFIAIVNEMSGENMNWFFDRFVFSNQTVDYQVERLRVRPITTPAGWYDSDTGKVFIKKPVDWFSDTASLYESSFVVTNNGEASFPVRIRAVFENNDTVWISWKGEDYTKTFSFVRPSRLREVMIDPERINVLDLNWTNNSIVAEPSTAGIWRYTSRLAFWIQNLFQCLIALI